MCGEADVVVLEFHHREPSAKSANISDMIKNKSSWARIEQLASSGCIDCGIADPLVLQFDHRERKTNNVSWAVSAGWSLRRLTEEIAKCDVRCANCHRRRTARMAGWSRLRLSPPT
jgi:hypothetical protein